MIVRFLGVALCCAFFLSPSTIHAMNKRGERSIRVDTLRDTTGALIYRIRCTDIVVHVRDGAWIRHDSIMFFSERSKVEWASTFLNKQVEELRDSLQLLADSAGAYITEGRYTRSGVDSAMTVLQATVEKTINTHNRSLRKLEDYHAVLDATRPYLRPSSPR